MDRVAKSARLSRALLYVYFRDKNDLLHAITERALIDLRERFVEAAAAHAKGIDKVQAIGRAYVLFQQEKPYRFDACTRFHAHQAAGQPGRERLRRRGRRRHRGDREAPGARAGGRSIRKDLGDPVQVCIMLWAFTHGLIQIATNKTRRDCAPGCRASAADGRLVRDAALHAGHEDQQLIFLPAN